MKILVLSPSRELATQTEKTIQSIGVHTNIRAQACIGGKSIAEDIKKLERGVHDVSGTPGRIYEMIKRASLQTKSSNEGEMLSKGFKDHIYKAYRYDVHVCFISCYFSSRDPEDDKQLNEKMGSSNFIVASMNGDKHQKGRDEIMNQMMVFLN
ncbi:hypothetical protein HID58_043823 [Brassica napus]|uniref:DEAD/DEAH-box helicase domain-containing protein n=1 Tax=Brassica napus TaxID=3708 RepID=A0ABQ8BHP8_BRANA|nr:hypothetical protein HID58_043823 [Brassica napus]